MLGAVDHCPEDPESLLRSGQLMGILGKIGVVEMWINWILRCLGEPDYLRLTLVRLGGSLGN
jgi:hypothetical protein